jgi:uncharacterized flavoprotein (TIGR03862 family)
VSGRVSIIGAGPAGLIAAERLAEAGHAVTIHDRMPSPARKFLMAGRGGLNLTHSEPVAHFADRYGSAAEWLMPLIADFPPSALIAWCEGLGQETFVGSSGRVFPRAMKASPLLRAWLARLDRLGVRLETRAEWLGLAPDGQPLFRTVTGDQTRPADAILLALGGASWPRLGADGGWAGVLAAQGVELTPFQPSNSGVTIPWSAHLARHAGAALKRITVTVGAQQRKGEAIITASGLEGGVIYALGPAIREALARDGTAQLLVDLRPDLGTEALAARLARARAGASLATRLASQAGLSPQGSAVVREGGRLPATPEALAARIKATPLTVTGLQGFARAISTAGGVARAAITDDLMLKRLPGVFVAGEMLDWDAPTGGYLLQACFATGVRAAAGINRWLDRAERPDRAER